LGYDKENIVVFPARGIKDYASMKNQLERIPGISQVSMANESIVEVQNQNSSFSWPGKAEDSRLYVRTIVVDYNFVETMGLKVLEGRSFSAELNDTASVMINKKLASLMNVENPIGMETNQWGLKGKIVGIVEDFHSRSLSESMDPMVLLCYPAYTGRFYVRIEPGKTQDALAAMGEQWKIASPLYPFEYTFLDNHYEKLYREEQVIGQISAGFTFMAILISGLGLLGLASYSTERKKKEISIRKVLGASVPNLIVLMSTEFIVLTAIALFIGCPVAYYFMNQFLEGYAYHITIEPSVFIVTSIGLMAVTLSVILFQVTRAAVTNPVNNLRSE
jgi:putative ABC transport system permease protein